MNHQSHDGGRQMIPANRSWLGEARWVQGADHLFGLVQSLVYFGEQFEPSRAWVHLARDGGQLLRRKLLAAQVGGQAFDAACDMPELKTYRRQAVRPKPEEGVRDPGGPMGEILANLRISVQRGHDQRMDACERTSQPRF